MAISEETSCLDQKHYRLELQQAEGMIEVLSKQVVQGCPDGEIDSEFSYELASGGKTEITGSFPDSTILLHYMLTLTTRVVDGLVVYKENMLQNLQKSRGMVFSQGLLLRLIEKGLTREESYKLVQDCAKQVWESKDTQLKEVVEQNSRITQFLNKEDRLQIGVQW